MMKFTSVCENVVICEKLHTATSKEKNLYTVVTLAFTITSTWGGRGGVGQLTNLAPFREQTVKKALDL